MITIKLNRNLKTRKRQIIRYGIANYKYVMMYFGMTNFLSLYWLHKYDILSIFTSICDSVKKVKKLVYYWIWRTQITLITV